MPAAETQEWIRADMDEHDWDEFIQSTAEEAEDSSNSRGRSGRSDILYSYIKFF